MAMRSVARRVGLLLRMESLPTGSVAGLSPGRKATGPGEAGEAAGELAEITSGGGGREGMEI